MLEALACWSKARLFWTLGIGYAIAVELVTLFASQFPPCLIGQIGEQAQNAEHNDCPAFHAVLFGLLGIVDEHGEAVTAVATIAILPPFGRISAMRAAAMAPPL